MSNEMSAIRLELIRANEEIEGDLLSQESRQAQDGESTMRNEVEHILLDLLLNKKWGKAIRLFQNSR